MLRKKRKNWMIQAFLTYQRIWTSIAVILMDSSCTNCTRLLLKIGRVSGFLFHDRLRSCSTSSNSLELPGFFDELVAYPTPSHDVLHLSVTVYSNILQNRWLLKNELSKPNPAFYSTTPLLHSIFRSSLARYIRLLLKTRYISQKRHLK
jgi:hypothetical protein